MKLQNLNYTENPIDIPNPDRGYYRPQSYKVPVDPGEVPTFPPLSNTIAGTTVSVDCRIVYMEMDLRNFSSNAPLDGLPLGEWSAPGAVPPAYGTTQPLTSAALAYIRAALQQVRDSEAVAIIKFSYDGQGYTYNNRDGYDWPLHDPEPGAARGRKWYERGGRYASHGGKGDGLAVEAPLEGSDLCGIAGHEEKNWVQYHFWQIGNVFAEYEDVIMAVKGGFFGPWGEMHSSTYANSKEANRWLLNMLLDNVPQNRSVLACAGFLMSWHNDEYGTDYNYTNIIPTSQPGTRAARFGMFNDSYSLGGADFTDQGAYHKGLAFVGGEFSRTRTLTCIRGMNNFYGGETNTIGAFDDPSNIYPLFPSVPYEAAFVRTTHLNCAYAGGVHRRWNDFVYNEENVTAPFIQPHDGVARTAIFDPVYDGRSGMVFMRDRLGYRLVLRASYVDEAAMKNGVIKWEGKIQNVGFGNIINQKRVQAVLMPKVNQWPRIGPFAVTVDIDPRQWRAADDCDGRATNQAAWHDTSFEVKIADFGDVPMGEYDLFLKINDQNEKSANKRSIQFANFDMWNADIGANLIGAASII